MPNVITGEEKVDQDLAGPVIILPCCIYQRCIAILLVIDFGNIVLCPQDSKGAVQSVMLIIVDVSEYVFYVTFVIII